MEWEGSCDVDAVLGVEAVIMEGYDPGSKMEMKWELKWGFFGELANRGSG